MKKLLLTIFMLTFLISGVMVGCGDKKVVLVDWKDTKTEKVELGSTYDITLTSVKDDKGNSYKVTSKVQKTSGVEVSVVSNQFEINDLSGYKITYTAKISDDDTRTSVCTLEVEDNGNPTIAIAAPPAGAVGVEYTLPKITVTDDSGLDCTKVVKVFYTGGENDEEVTLTDGKFTPSKVGEYAIRVEGKDHAGNTNTASATFVVRAAVVGGEIENYNDEASIENLYLFNGNSQKEWLETYEGETGVVKASFDGTKWPAFSFKPRQQMSAYIDGGYTHIRLRAFVPDITNAFKHFKLGNGTSCDSFPIDGENSIVKGVWKDYVFPIAPFKEVYGEAYQDEFLKARIWSETPTESATHIYISDIEAVKEVEFSVSLEGEKVVGKELQIAITSTPNVAFTYKLFDASGTEVAVVDNKFTAASSKYKVVATANAAGYYSVQSFDFDIAYTIGVAVDEYDGTYTVGTEITFKDSKLMNNSYNTEITTGYTKDISVKYYNNDVTVDGEKFTPESGGIYVITYSYTYEDETYTKDVEIEVARGAAAANEMESFDCEGTRETTSMRSGTFKEYSKTFKPTGAASGSIVFSITQGSENWPILYSPIRKGLGDYSGYNAIEFTLYIKSSKATSVGLNFFNGNAQRFTVKCNEWVTVRLDMDLFRELGYQYITTPNKGWFWFTNEGGNSVQEVAFNGIMAVTIPEETGTEYGVYNSEASKGYISTDEASAITYHSADAITADTNLPALTGGDAGYVGIENTGSAEWFNFKIKPQCTFETFSAADKMIFKMYIKSDAAVTSVPMFYFNTKLGDIKTNEWVNLVMPLSIWRYTANTGVDYVSQRAFFMEMVNGREKLFMLSKAANYTVYMASINLENDTVDATLGDKYAHLTPASVTCDKGAVTAGEFFGKESVKIPGGSWVNVLVKPGKTYTELMKYSKIVLDVYMEGGAADIGIFTQYNPLGSGNIAKYHTAPKNGQWTKIEISIEDMSKYYYSFVKPEDKRALFITNGATCTALYIASIECVK